MSTFVLVHGSWHGGWCWERLVPLLEAAGHRVLAPDLDGLGADPTPPGLVTLQTWTDQIGRLVDDLPEPAILVGHSRGGIVISQVAEERPDAITALVYLAACLPRDGESLFQLAQTDTESTIMPNLVVDEAQGFHTIRPEAAAEIFYHDCPPADAERSVARLRPEPNAPTFTPLHLTDGGFGRVPRFYLTCLQDRAIGPALQERMFTAQPCRQVISLETGHFPMYSAPDETARHLGSIAAAADGSPAGRAAPAAMAGV
jgi:pimeloyl-ACP methyl ester carboxylesterase